MNSSNDQTKTVQDDQVVTMDFTLRVDGGVVDTSEGEDGEPIQFIQGQGQIVPGLERELYGMNIGESKHVIVSPEEGYGEVDNSAYVDVPRSEFPPDIPLETGVALQLRGQDGETLDAYIVEVRPDTVKLNFNHPLAGKELHFTVKVVDLRDATEEEIAHGHVHGEGGIDEDYEEWDEDDEESQDWEGEQTP